MGEMVMVKGVISNTTQDRQTSGVAGRLNLLSLSHYLTLSSLTHRGCELAMGTRMHTRRHLRVDVDVSIDLQRDKRRMNEVISKEQENRE